MTIEELIKVLSIFPSGMRVLVDGYESGFDEIVIRGPVNVVPGCVRPPSVLGMYEEDDIDPKFSAIVLARTQDKK